jgi:hypothetical protein
MDETFEKEIQRLKAELLAHKDDIEDIRTLVKQEIDCEFHPTPWASPNGRSRSSSAAPGGPPGKPPRGRADAPSPTARSSAGRSSLKKVFQSWADIYAKAFLDKQNPHQPGFLDLIMS